MLKIITVLSAFFIFTMPLTAQDHDHHHARNEVGLSGGALFSPEEGEWGSSIHVHYFRTLSPDSRWSLGGGVEQAWLDGGHFSVMAGAKYELFERFNVGLMPGVTFAKHNHKEGGDHVEGHEKSEAMFLLHIETVYDMFHWEKFHLGPAIDYGWSSGDSHLMFGIHAAMCF